MCLCNYGVQELDLVLVRFICELNGVVYSIDPCHVLFQLR